MSTISPAALRTINPTEDPTSNGNPGHWPRDILEAYARYRGPYTLETAETILEEEPVELYNGWLVWQEMTNIKERRVVANIVAMLDISARKAGFGQSLPDQHECLLSDGSVVKPDASLISWQRLREEVTPYGPRQRPTLIGGPELVVEVRSPSNRRAQERRKRALYFANRVQIVWDVDEVAEVIWVYRAEAPAESTRFDLADLIDCEPLLPGWRRRVADIFAEQASAEVVAGEAAQAWRDEGRVEGMNEGMAQALRAVLPMLVRVRYAVDPPTNLALRLALADLAQLQELQVAVETSNTLDEWLVLVPRLS
jgi:Uma2 family endonuclease